MAKRREGEESNQQEKKVKFSDGKQEQGSKSDSAFYPQLLPVHYKIELIDFDSKKFAQDNPQFTSLMTMAKTSISVLKYEDAVIQFEAAYKSGPKDINKNPYLYEILNNWGYALLCLNQYGKAIEKFDEAIRLKPGMTVAYINKGNALFAQEKFPEALECFTKAHEIAVNDENIINCMACTMSFMRDYIGAAKCFSKANAVNSKNINILINWATLLINIGDYKEAKQKIVEAEALDPNNAFVLYNKKALEKKCHNVLLENNNNNNNESNSLHFLHKAAQVQECQNKLVSLKEKVQELKQKANQEQDVVAVKVLSKVEELIDRAEKIKYTEDDIVKISSYAITKVIKHNIGGGIGHQLRDWVHSSGLTLPALDIFLDPSVKQFQETQFKALTDFYSNLRKNSSLFPSFRHKIGISNVEAMRSYKNELKEKLIDVNGDERTWKQKMELADLIKNLEIALGERPIKRKDWLVR